MEKAYRVPNSGYILLIAFTLSTLTGCTQPSPPLQHSRPANSTVSQDQSPVSPSQTTWTTLHIGHHTFDVEIADQDDNRSLGLMYRTKLPPNHGMLFMYPSPRTISMWMKNTLLPLDVAFIDEHGKIINIDTMKPLTLNNHSSQGPCVYSLEMNAQWFQQHGIEAGMSIEGLPDYKRANP